MPYKTVSLMCAALFAAHALALFLVPGLIYALFSLPAAPTANILSRRTALLFLGLASLALLTAGHPDSPTRRAIAAAFILTFATLAILGLAEWLRGVVGPGIFVAILGEIALAVLLARAR